MDYRTWKQQYEKAADKKAFFASDRRAAQNYFPIYVQQELDSQRGIKTLSLTTADYAASFQEWEFSFRPEVKITNRNRYMLPENHQGPIPELARYVATKLGRTGLSEIILNKIPDAIAESAAKSDDAWHNLFWPITSRVGKFLNECFD